MTNLCFFNSEKKWGGGEKWHFKMAKLFSEHGYNVILAGRNNSELLQKAYSQNMDIKGFNIGKYSFLNIVKIFQIYKFLKKNNIDTIFMNSSIDLKLCFIPCKMAGVKNVIYRRGMPHPIKNTLLNRLLFSKLLTKLIVNSKEIERSIFINNDKIISRDKVLLLYNGIDKNDYKNNGEKVYDNDENLVIFGNSGRLVEQKGQIHLLEAAKILKEKGYSFKVLIAGKGKLEEYLKEKIDEYNLNNEVILLGFIDKIEEFMNSIDVFVFPSHFEGSANAIVEAMYFGKPVVCFDVSSMPELVEDNENGYLVEYLNIDELVRKMENFLNDPELIAKMGKKSKEISEDYDILKIMKKLENSILKGQNMNILFLTYQGDIAGSTNSISYLAEGLAEKGHNVYVGCRKEALLYSLLSDTKVKLIEMTFKSKMDFANMKHIKKIVEDYKIDIINPQSSKDRYNANLAKFFYRLPVKVVHTRRQTPKSSGIFIQNWFYNNFTDLIVAVSDEVKAELVKSGIKESKVKVIYNGTPDYKYNIIDPEKAKTLKEKYSYKAGDIIIGSISRKKEQDQIIKALGKLPENYKLLLIGIHDHEFKEYEDLINSLNLKDRIISLGMIPGEETLNHYQILDVDVLASNMEGLSQSLLEAMYLGVPVTATKAAGNISLIKDGVNGLFFDDGDIDKIAENIKKIIEDKELRERLTTEGKKTARIDFSINRVIENYENVFEKLISQ